MKADESFALSCAGMRVIAIDDLSGGFLANVLRTAEPLAEKTLSGDSQRFS